MKMEVLTRTGKVYQQRITSTSDLGYTNNEIRIKRKLKITQTKRGKKGIPCPNWIKK
jgi:hypothetical protein